MRRPNVKQVSALGWPLLAAALAAVGTPASAQEVWVINELSRDISIVDADAEQVVDTMSLADLNDAPRCVAFSSVPGWAGSFAFVGQGTTLRVIDTALRQVVSDIDVGALLGQSVDLRGCAATRPRQFTNGAATEIRSYLHVAADIGDGQSAPTPCFLVFDQAELIDNPQGNVLIANGPLGDTPPGAIREALDVTVLSAPAGPWFQRAWYGYRETSPDPALFGALVATEREVGSPWSVVDEQTEAFPQAQSLPQGVRIGGAYDRELTAWPLHETQLLRNLDTGGSCSLPGFLRGAAIAGLGPGSHDVVAIDDSIVPGMAYVLDPGTCSFQSFTVGNGPRDLVMADPREWKKVFIANRDSDSLSVIRFDGSQAEIELGLQQPFCQLCPVFLEINFPEPYGCTVRNVRVERDKSDIIVSWTPVGCPEDERFKVVCRCRAEPCPPRCSSAPTTGGSPDGGSRTLESGSMTCDGDWKEADTTGPGDTSYLHMNGATGGDTCYSVRP